MGNSVTCCNDRERSESGVRSTLPPEQTFNVTLPKDSKQKEIGLTICREQKALEIIGVESPSRASEWNKANPGKRLRVGDRVVAINGNRGTGRELANLLTPENTLDLMVKRYRVSPNMFDGYWRTSDGTSVVVSDKKARFERSSKDASEGEHTWTFDVHDVDCIVASDPTTSTASSGPTFQATFAEGELRWDDDDVWVRDYTQYRLDKSGLESVPPPLRQGMSFCTRQELSAKAPRALARWGETIKAHDLQNGWVGVHSAQGTYYLPTHVEGVQVLTVVPDTPTEEADTPGGGSTTPTR